jgi:phosphoglycerate dehydrogenase-like enzyme
MFVVDNFPGSTKDVMPAPIKVVAPALMRAKVEPHLPEGVSVSWFDTSQEAIDLAPQAEVGWFDLFSLKDRADAIVAATNVKWLNTIVAGLDALPLDVLRQRNVVVTNGSGLNSETVADYAVMGVLTMAKGYPDVVRAFDRREWPTDAPGRFELDGSRALVIGYGTIGRMIGKRLEAFGVRVTGVRRTAAPDEDILDGASWRGQLGDFDWVIVAAPATDQTKALIGADELAAMKDSARIVNIARGDLIDQVALIAALEEKRIGGAFLDVTTPEPLPSDHPLWNAPNCMITMHLSGRSQTSMFPRGAERFVANLRSYVAGEPLKHQVDLAAGY